MQKSIGELLAEAAIRDIHIRYCRALDRLDVDLLRTCFHPGATIDLGPYKGDVDGFFEMAAPGLAQFTTTTHFIGNQLCKVAGDVGWAEHYTIAHHRIAADDAGPERDFVCLERYVDRMECRDGDWRIVRRILLIDSSRTDPLSGDGQPMDGNRGTRDRSDPSWTMP